MAMIERGAAGTPEREAFYTRINAFGRASSREPVCPPVASRPTTHYRPPSGLFGCVSCEAREPENHPLRAIRAIVDEALELLSAQFEGHYGRGRSPSIASEKLQRSLLLKAFYTIRSEPQLIEQLGYNLLFRWFVGLPLDAPLWDAGVFTNNCEPVLASDVAGQFLAAVVSHPRVERLLSNEHFSVDTTVVESWGLAKRLKPRGGHGEQPRPGHDAEGDLYGENGERMPYYPARPRQQRSDELDVPPRECSRFLDYI